MDTESCWELFCATGDPMAYMLYREESSRENKEYYRETEEYKREFK